ncbi:crotonase/enoyl-CoA hydratase family protein [Ottowia thiooxydans]|uniref:Enoyl-CoA hydratase n=1 Tax=Ottowia thiooxydans TaxID=219182 RepID=A0ABV2Q9F3_9BURK
MSSKILIEKDGAVTTIIINRPEVRNALDLETTEALGVALRTFELDESARVAVLCGAGGAFCAGADLKELAAGTVYDAWAGEHGPLSRPLAKPVIAAIAGYACAGGLGIALWCDLRVVEASATFAVLSRRWGVPMSDGTTVRLPRLIGLSRALDMLLTARKVGAEEALAMGLANRVVEDGCSRAEAQSLAQMMCEFPQVAMRSDRMSAYHQEGMDLSSALIAEDTFAAEAKTLEAGAGAAQFASGRGRHGALR